MKKLFIMSLFILSITASAQVDIGKIEVCSQYTATLMFATDIELVVFGNNPLIGVIDGVAEYENYSIFESGKTLILKANKENIASTSINVKTVDGTLWYGFLEYRENTTLFHDFTKKVQPSSGTGFDNGHPEATENRTPEKKNEYEKKLEHVMNQLPEYSNFGIISGKLIFMVPNIMNDTENMYLKVVINNQSGNAFEINSVVFKHIEGKTKNIKKNQVQNEERVIPVFEKSVDMIEAYTKKELGYVLPLFSTGTEGKLIIQFVENRGTRNYQIELSAKEMQKIKVFR